MAARCARVRAGAGAVSSQNVTDPRLGPAVLDELAAGRPAGQAVAAVVERAGALAAFRQLLAVDRNGTTAIHSGERALGLVATRQGDGCAAAGNLLADAGVADALVEAFAADPSLPAGRAAACARWRRGLAAGGRGGAGHSAGLLVAAEVEWPVVDLRSDWSESPIADVRAAWEVYAPQVDDYVRRALDPGAAPAFGVPGDPQ